MKCLKCGTEQPDSAKFCNECGNKLQPSGYPDTYLEQSRTHPTIAPERKHVTVLFSDITGYTSITERLDPEQVKQLTGSIFAGVKKIVTRYEGFIERVMGDCVVAFFGVPQVHEDDPIRAVNTAIEIHDLVKGLSSRYEGWVGSPLSMHTGINTGLVVTADVDLERGTHGIAGDAVTVAARLSLLAGPGEILVGEETLRRTRERFNFHDLGLKQVKGKAAPILVFKVIAPKSSVSRAGADRQVFSEMVGRDRELDRIELQVMKVVNGDGSVVNVFGEAGIGKSRLIEELRKREVMKRVMFLECRAVSIGKNLSFHPLIDLMKQWSGIAEGDSGSAGFDKLERAIRAIHPDEANEILPFLATLMGMKLKGRHAERVKRIEGEALEKLIFKNVRDLLVRWSDLRPTVIVIEDLHWADESSLGLLESLYPLVEKSRLLFINVFRPGYWQGKKLAVERIGAVLPQQYVEIAPQPLDKQMSEVLIGNMLNIKGLPYSMCSKISERAGGNPFFIEEVVRSLIDQGAVVKQNGSFEVTEKIYSIIVPDTINDVLMARIDRLEERTRELVKCASVIGRSFFDRILKDVATAIEDIDSKLTYLKDLQLIRDRVRMQELEYLFKHALAQEVAYESTLLQQRKEIHRLVAGSIEKLFKDRLHEFYGTLAYHYSKAEDAEKAEEWMVKAGEEALRTSASSEALHYYKEALRLYLDKCGDMANPEKVAEFEKNIAIAYYNKGHWGNAANYFDRVFSRGGIRRPKSRVAVMAQLAYDLLAISLRLYLPSIKRKNIADKRVSEFFDLSLKKDFCLHFTAPKRCLTESINDLRKSYKYDLTKLHIAAALHTGTSTVLALAGFQRMTERVLLQAGKLVDPQKVQDVVVYNGITSLIYYNCGKWSEMPVYNRSLFKTALRNGVLTWAAAYAYYQGLAKAYKGQFSEASELLQDYKILEEEYQYGSVALNVLSTIMILVRRSLHKVVIAANDVVSNAIEKGANIYELEGLGLRAIAQVLMRDIAGAKDSLASAEEFERRQAYWPPHILYATQTAQFMLDLQMLEEATAADSRQLVSEYAKAALKSGKKAVRNSARFAAQRTESYRLMGVYYWLIGRHGKALKWFDKSIWEGERLGARPDIARTCMEIGKRLIGSGSKYKELKGVSAREYLKKAGNMFEEMDLQWDLEELEKVENGP
ncbi:MAG: AAA family ATPase [Syntrophobacteraceae bacterium]